MVMTKKWLYGILPIPHTSIMPKDFSQLGRLGIQINWSTRNVGKLSKCHKKLIELVNEIGLQALRENASERGFVALDFWLESLTPELAKHIKRIL